LSAVFVRRRQVDLIAEDDEPSADLGWSELDTIHSLLVLAVLLESLDEQIGSCCAGEIEADNLHMR
nr:hypothetical protein [Tanacetum cinerariifolium]